MANYIKEHRLYDTNRRTLLKYVCVSDGTQFANTTLVDVSSLSYALNANGYIMTSNVHPKSSYGTTIVSIKGNASLGNSAKSFLKLQWEGDSNSEIIVATDYFDYGGSGGGSVVGAFTNPESNSTGDILISTVNMEANDVFTIFVELKKEAIDYDQGQTADPAAFNRGPYAP